ncbi:MAG TPA: GNAT family N-acetyltransferase [Caulobacteraceae bacterium]
MHIALATESEAPAALALVPESRGLPCEWLIARVDGQLAGAAAIAWRAWGTPGGFPVSIQVLPEMRRRGVGRALAAAAMDLADGDADGLWSLGLYPTHGDVADFLAACGFAPRRRHVRFEAAIQSLLDLVAPLAARARRSMPADARIVPLSEAPLEEIGWLLAREFGGGPFRVLHGLRRRAIREDDRSQAMLDGEDLAGAILWRVIDGMAHVDARVVAPRWRGGWTNLLLLEAGLVLGLAEGLTRLRFHCDDTVRDTISLARRCAADQLESGAYYYAAMA